MDRLVGSEPLSEGVQKGKVKRLLTATALVGKNEIKDKRGPDNNHVLRSTKRCPHGVPLSSRSNSISSYKAPQISILLGNLFLSHQKSPDFPLLQAIQQCSYFLMAFLNTWWNTVISPTPSRQHFHYLL